MPADTVQLLFLGHYQPDCLPVFEVVAGTDGLGFARPTFQEGRIERASAGAICTVSEFRAVSSDSRLDGGIL